MRRLMPPQCTMSAHNLVQAVRAAHGHGVLQLGEVLGVEHADALLGGAVHGGDEGAGDEHGVGAQGEGLEDVHAVAQAAVHEDGGLPADGGGYLRQDVGAGAGLAQHAAAVVGNHYAGGAGLHGLSAPRTVIMPLTMKGILAYLIISESSATLLLPALGFMALRKGSHGAVDVHGGGEDAAGIEYVQLLLHGLDIPGLYGGYAHAAPAGPLWRRRASSPRGPRRRRRRRRSRTRRRRGLSRRCR